MKNDLFFKFPFLILITSGTLSALPNSERLQQTKAKRKSNAHQNEWEYVMKMKEKKSIDIKRQIHWLIKKGSAKRKSDWLWFEPTVYQLAFIRFQPFLFRFVQTASRYSCSTQMIIINPNVLIEIELNSVFESIKCIICFIWLWCWDVQIWYFRHKNLWHEQYRRWYNIHKKKRVKIEISTQKKEICMGMCEYGIEKHFSKHFEWSLHLNGANFFTQQQNIQCF